MRNWRGVLGIEKQIGSPDKKRTFNESIFTEKVYESLTGINSGKVSIEVHNISPDLTISDLDSVKNEMEEIGWVMFYDEDAFRGYFSKKQKHFST